MSSTDTKYAKAWENVPEFKGWLAPSKAKDNLFRASCVWCNSDFSIGGGGKRDVQKHMQTKKHQVIVKFRLTLKPVNQCFGMFICCIFLTFLFIHCTCKRKDTNKQTKIAFFRWHR